MGLVEKLLDTCIRLLQTKWERRWGIREKMLAYQDLLSLFGIFYVSPIFDIGIERRKDVQCEIVKLFAVYLFSLNLYVHGRTMLTMYKRWIRHKRGQV